MEDYLRKYFIDNKLDLPSLINDDFFLSIKLCIQNQRYTSANKLLMSFIDTISFLTYGESTGINFQKWLKTYCDMSKLNVTPFELWEHRNSILHMSNLTSRKVQKEECRVIIPYIGDSTYIQKNDNPNIGYYNITTLIKVVSKGLEILFSELYSDINKLKTFIGNYDTIVSDSRYQIFTIKEL